MNADESGDKTADIDKPPAKDDDDLPLEVLAVVPPVAAAAAPQADQPVAAAPSEAAPAVAPEASPPDAVPAVAAPAVAPPPVRAAAPPAVSSPSQVGYRAVPRRYCPPYARHFWSGSGTVLHFCKNK